MNETELQNLISGIQNGKGQGIAENNIRELKDILVSPFAHRIPSNVLIEIAGLDDATGTYVVTEPDPDNPYFHSQDSQLYAGANKEVVKIYKVDCSKVRSLAQGELNRRGEGKNLNFESNPLKTQLIGSWSWAHIETTFNFKGNSISKRIDREITDMATYSPNGTGIYKKSDNTSFTFKYTISKSGLLQEVIGDNEEIYRIEINDNNLKKTHIGSDSVSEWKKKL